MKSTTKASFKSRWHARFTSLVLTAGLLWASLPGLPAAAAQKFEDVDPGAWYYEAVSSVVEKGLFAGTSETKFSPNTPMTRGMFIQVLANLTDNYGKCSEEDIAYFADVPKTAWYYSPIQWGRANGIASGKGLGKFDPEGLVTREEMVTLLFNYALKTGEATEIDYEALAPFTDKGSISPWSGLPFQWAVSSGSISGITKTTLSPKTNATRAQVASMLHKAYDGLKRRKTVPNPVECPDPPAGAYQNALGFYDTGPDLGAFTGKDNVGYDDAKTVLESYSIFPGAGLYAGIDAYVANTSFQSARTSFFDISLPVKDLFPEIVGKTLGEAVGVLGSSVHTSLSFQEEGYSPFFSGTTIRYDTNPYQFNIEIDTMTMRIPADGKVFIRYADYSRPVAIPADRVITLSMPVSGKDTPTFKEICTITLPESFRHAVILDKKEYHVTFINEPVSYLRYGAYNPALGTILTLDFHEEFYNEKGTPIRAFTYENRTHYIGYRPGLGLEYMVVPGAENPRFIANDLEYTASQTLMMSEIQKVLDSIVFKPGIPEVSFSGKS